MVDGAAGLPWLAEPLRQAQLQQSGHALLVSGPAGAGQFEFALALVQSWLCDGATKPCGRCPACRQMQQRSHPDLQLLVTDQLRVQFGWLAQDDPLAKADAKPSKEIRIDQVRQAVDWAHATASQKHGKALVLHPAQALNLSSASALLKTLEEPPGPLRLLLCADDPARLLPTVRSRCQVLRLPLPSTEQALEWLKAKGIDAAQSVLRLAAGSPLTAMQLIDEGLNETWVDALPKAVAQGDPGPLAGKAVPRVVDLLHKLAHDAACVALNGRPRYFASASIKPHADLGALIEWQRNLVRVARHDDHPWNAGLLVEALVTEGARAWAGAGAKAARSRPHSINSRDE
jgi:DNA polymerase III subunit delta'